MTSGFITWPEGQPERAQFGNGRFLKAYRHFVHPGFIESLRGRRMCCAWPVSIEESPIVLARECERRRRRC